MPASVDNSAIEKSANALFEYLYAALKDNEGRVRAEDMIVAAASIVGERCIGLAGNLNVLTHTFVPGSHILSDRVNEVLAGTSEQLSLQALPAESVFGMLRDRLSPRAYPPAEFPALQGVFEYFAAHINDAAWGFVPLSVPQLHWPRITPIQVTFESRPAVDNALQPLGDSAALKLTASTAALALTLDAVESVIDHKIALSLAFETINGMAKTAPMTVEAFVNGLKPR